jgi:hypothetical protein
MKSNFDYFQDIILIHIFLFLQFYYLLNVNSIYYLKLVFDLINF